MSAVLIELGCGCCCLVDYQGWSFYFIYIKGVSATMRHQFLNKGGIVILKLANVIQTKAYENQTVLNAVGLVEVCFLKKLLKCVASEKPRA